MADKAHRLTDQHRPSIREDFGREMKITKKYAKTYEIIPPAIKWQMSVGDFIAKRKELGLKTQGYDRCFVCGCVFEKDFMPNLASVKTKGNMFFCDKCADEINAHPTEKGGGAE